MISRAVASALLAARHQASRAAQRRASPSPSFSRDRAALATGGFNVFARHVRTRLEFDAVFANELVVDGGRLTGEVREPILTREGKREALIGLAAEKDIPLRLTLAIGDGANDLPMLEAAGLGVAFHAKPSVAERSAHRLDYCDLTALLYAQGYRAAEFAAV